MGHDPVKMTVEEIKEALPKLPRAQIIELDKRIHDYLETSMLTRASETAFLEWQDPEEDIYATKEWKVEDNGKDCRGSEQAERC